MLSVLLVVGPDSYLRPDDIEAWEKLCIVSYVGWMELTGYLRLGLSAKHALVDAIAFLPGQMDDFHSQRCRAITEEVRRLPENCCMRDGRKWKKTPCVALCETDYDSWELREAEIPAVRYCPVDYNWRFATTLQRLQNIVNAYHDRVLAGYQNVGISVEYERGRFRVRWALQKKDTTRGERILSLRSGSPPTQGLCHRTSRHNRRRV